MKLPRRKLLQQYASTVATSVGAGYTDNSGSLINEMRYTNEPHVTKTNTRRQPPSRQRKLGGCRFAAMHTVPSDRAVPNNKGSTSVTTQYRCQVVIGSETHETECEIFEQYTILKNNKIETL